ncbi:hypothetical protein MMC28_007497 [Mycoblastus sanguinarius]|nr:hypothetical protein [Mycoblastus sanguinarius]
MSSASAPIPPYRFAEAIKDLPLANLHIKAAEIRNSLLHLESSNQQLQDFADAGDSDCAEAIQENEVVIQRMEERVRLLKQEVEGRGFQWGEDELEISEIYMNGHTNDIGESEATLAQPDTEQRTGSTGGRLGDEELARRLADQMEDEDDANDDGVHL